MLKNDLIGFTQEFHVNAILPKLYTSLFLTLIPKNKNPIGLEEYKPICLVGSVYKVLSKIMALKLKLGLGSIIFLTQSAFIPSR